MGKGIRLRCTGAKKEAQKGHYAVCARLETGRGGGKEMEKDPALSFVPDWTELAIGNGESEKPEGNASNAIAL